MANLMIRHRVKDYETWKKAFDEYIDKRRAAGEKTWRIFHTDDDRNNIFVLHSYESFEKARAFVSDPGLREAMNAAGVIEEPEIFFLDEHSRGRVDG